MAWTVALRSRFQRFIDRDDALGNIYGSLLALWSHILAAHFFRPLFIVIKSIYFSFQNKTFGSKTIISKIDTFSLNGCGHLDLRALLGL